MSTQSATHGLSRRGLLGAAAALAAVGSGTAHATPAEVDDFLKKATGGAAMKDGKIVLEVPQIAENGASVPFTVKVESPMTEKDYVKEIHVAAEANPLPGVVTYRFTPASGRAEAQARMRLAKTQKITAVAVMSDGTVYRTQQEVKVTVGGC